MHNIGIHKKYSTHFGKDFLKMELEQNFFKQKLH